MTSNNISYGKSKTNFKGSKKFENTYRSWKNKLLDMSHRNRQLYFRPSRRTTLEIIFPDMYSLFRTLVIRGKTCRFPPIFESSEFNPLPNESQEDYKKRMEEQHWRNIREKMKEGKPTQIITKKSNKVLEKLLKQLRKKSQSFMQEQGINILYITFGLVKWFEPDRKHEVVFSPVLFVPIKIYRKRILDDFKLEILDDDVILNPSLVEKFRCAFRVELPKFPDEFDENTLTTYFQELLKIIKKGKNWQLFYRSFIGLFSFEKLRMYKDLEENKEALWNHKIIRAIAEGKGFENDPSTIPNKTEYSDEAEPQDSYHILDSDSSQFQAITYAKKGASMVIRGPPGTGKSQAISNIIAECLAVGKKVLFVSEKMAALEVVKKRLDKCGVGEFCLVLHSQQENKNDVLKQIQRSLGNELNPRTYSIFQYRKLRNLRLKLDDYIKNIHTPIMEEFTIYNRIGEYQKYNNIILLDAIIRRPLEFTNEDLFDIEDAFGELDAYRDILEDYKENPWYGVRFLEYYQGLKEDLYDWLNNVLDTTKKIKERLSIFEDRYNLYPITNIRIVDKYLNFFSQYTHHALELNVAEFKRFQSFVKVFNTDYKRLMNKLKKAVKTKIKGNENQHLKNIEEFQKEALDEPRRPSYEGIEEDFEPIAADKYKIEENYYKAKYLYEQPKVPHEEGETEWDFLEKQSTYWLSNMNSFTGWLAINLVIERLKKYGLEPFIDEMKNKLLPEVDLYKLFLKAYLNSWITEALGKFPGLSTFSAKNHQKIKDNFIKLDDQLIKLNRYRLCEKLFEKRPHALALSKMFDTSEYSIILREIAKKRKRKPLRLLIPETRNFITKLKPCFMMSPLSVSKYLNAEYFTEYFDVVIFDEASQIAPEDAIGAILRGKQAIIVGDEKQLPPTSFFSKSLYESVDAFDTEVDVFDSILEECTGIGLPIVMLKYHYRSRREDLIAFSNFHFYENNLISFPDPIRKGHESDQSFDTLPAIEYHYIENGVYDKGRTRKNKIEAKKVAEFIVQHFRDNIKYNTSYSLGVIAFSEAQQDAITSELEKLYKQDPEIENIIGEFDEEPLFIKNLENVQGDERDFIFFSVGYGKDKEGKMTLNFGPLNKEGGERRLNVAITRARYHIKIFCSFLPHELNVERTRSAGVHLLADYLAYARTGTFEMNDIDKALSQQFPPGPLELEIKKRLESLGYEVDLKIGRSKFQVDLAIVDPENPSKYMLGLELDGGSYALMPIARDREKTRQVVLKSLGWEYMHIWSIEWYRNPDAIIKQIDSYIKQIIKKRKIKKERMLKEEEEKEEKEAREAKEAAESFIISQASQGKGIASDNLNASLSLKQVSFLKNRAELFKLPGVVEYKRYIIKEPKPPKLFNNLASRRKALREIIEKEGPIFRTLLEKRVREYFNLRQLTPNMKKVLDDTLNDFNEEDDFYFPTKYPPNLLRIEREKGTDPRNFTEISDLELKNALKLILNNSLSITKDELFLRAIQIFGFTSRKPKYVNILNALLDELIQNNEIDVSKIRDMEVGAEKEAGAGKKIITPISDTTTPEKTEIAPEISYGDMNSDSSNLADLEHDAPLIQKNVNIMFNHNGTPNIQLEESEPPIEQDPITEEDIDEVLNDDDINQLISDAEKNISIDQESKDKIRSHENIEEEKELDYSSLINIDTIKDVMSNELEYSTEDLINEFDIDDERGIQVLNYNLKEMLHKNLITTEEKDGIIYWKLK